jgi:TPR repeat protein
MSGFSQIQFQKSLLKAQQSDPTEQYMVGHYYNHGIGVSLDKSKAKEFSDLALAKLQEIQSAAEKGNPQAQYVWGKVHAIGQGVRRNDEIAVKWYKKAVKRGNVNGQVDLGFMYQKGRGVQKNDAKAVKWYRKAAEQGHPNGQVDLGFMYQKGRGVQIINYAKAVKWYQKAAEQGHADGQNALGYMYELGWGVQKNYDEAIKWYTKAVEQGHAEGQRNLGSMYRYGHGVQKNYDEAIKWYRKAAEQGDAVAQSCLERMQEQGLGTQQNYNTGMQEVPGKLTEAKRVQEQNCQDMHQQSLNMPTDSKAPEQKDADGWYNLGSMFYNSHGVQQNYSEAVKYYKKAAEQGHADGQNSLGFMYQHGLGIQRSYAEAMNWYRKAAEQGLAIGQNNLGVMYGNGLGIQRNYAEAVSWYRKAAEQGYADGQNNLGIMYEGGLGVQKNEIEAVKWFRKAAEQGNAHGQNNLGRMYYYGCGVQKYYAEAMNWYRKAAEQGDPEGQNNLGSMYKNGHGIQRNYEEALKWFRKAAEQGNADGQNNLGIMYEYELGVQRNYEEALKWYEKAAEQGNIRALHNVKRMKKQDQRAQQNHNDGFQEWRKKVAELKNVRDEKLQNMQKKSDEVQIGRRPTSCTLNVKVPQIIHEKQSITPYLEIKSKDKIEQGNVQIQNDLEWKHKPGRGNRQSYDQAMQEWIGKLAESKRVQEQNCQDIHQQNHNIRTGKKMTEQGDADVQFNLGLLYEKGLGAQQNYSEALKCYKNAAEQGHADGQNNLGCLYRDGLGVQKNHSEAVKWLRKAAEQGHAEGQNNLGYMYQHGLGVLQNYDEALKWYRKAAAQGHAQAQNNLEQMQQPNLNVQQSNDKSEQQEQPERLAEPKKAQEQSHLSVDKPSLHTPIVKNPTPPPQKVAVVESTPKKEPVKPSQEKKFKETPEQEITENTGYHETLLSQHWKIKPDDLKDKVQVGSGGCGKVFKGSWQGSQVAIKELHGRLGPAELEELRKEALIMSQLHHPHIIHLFGITQASPHCLVMEWMEKGSFYRVLREEQLNFEQKGKILLGAARGLAFLHSRNMIHRDIKSLNILLKKSYKAKIGDFGLSQVKKSLRSQSNQGLSAGTLHWKAPEVLKFGGKHTLASDVYAFGIVMWEALTGKEPYEEADNEVQISLHVQGGGRPEIPEGTPKWYQELMEKCWSQNPQDRPSAEEVASKIASELVKEKPLALAQCSQSNLSSGYLLHSPKPVRKPANRIPRTSGYLDNFYSQQFK